jgi:hypothetical protein
MKKSIQLDLEGHNLFGANWLQDYQKKERSMCGIFLFGDGSYIKQLSTVTNILIQYK